MGTKLGLVALQGDHLAEAAQMFAGFGLREVEGAGGIGSEKDVESWLRSSKPRAHNMRVTGRLRGNWTTFQQEDAWRVDVEPFQREAFAAHFLRRDLEAECQRLVDSLRAPSGYRNSGSRGEPRMLVARGYGVEDTYHFRLFHAGGVRSISSVESTLTENRGAPFPEEPRNLAVDECFGENEVFTLMECIGIDFEDEQAEHGPFVFKLFQVHQKPWWKLW